MPDMQKDCMITAMNTEKSNGSQETPSMIETMICVAKKLLERCRNTTPPLNRANVPVGVRITEENRKIGLHQLNPPVTKSPEDSMYVAKNVVKASEILSTKSHKIQVVRGILSSDNMETTQPKTGDSQIKSMIKSVSKSVVKIAKSNSPLCSEFYSKRKTDNMNDASTTFTASSLRPTVGRSRLRPYGTKGADPNATVLRTSTLGSHLFICRNMNKGLADEIGVSLHSETDSVRIIYEPWVAPEKHGLENSPRIIPDYYMGTNMRNKVLTIDYHYMILDDIRNLRPLNKTQLEYIDNNLNETQKHEIIVEFNQIIKYYCLAKS